MKAEKKIKHTHSKEPATNEINQLILLFNIGEYSQVENQTRVLLNQHPRSGLLWKVLGAALKMQGKEAIAALQCAADLLPHDAEAHSNLGAALRDTGQFDHAVASCERAIKIKPDFVEALYNLGNAQQELKQFSRALGSFQRVLQLNPDHAETLSNMGIILLELGKPEEALTCLKRALEINPGFSYAHCNLGSVLKKLGKTDEAVASYRRALEINPDYADAHSNLGFILLELHQYNDAITSLQRTLEINPEHTDALCNLSSAQLGLGLLDDAATSCRRLLEIDPAYVAAHFNLGNALLQLGKLEEAVSSFSKAVEIDPELSGAHCNLGTALLQLGKIDESRQSSLRALEINPESPEAYCNLGTAQQALGNIDEAILSYRRSREINPDFDLAHSSLLFFLFHKYGVSREEIIAEHTGFGERFEAPLRGSWPHHTNDRDPQKRLQIGFVSGDLRSHAIARLIEPVLTHLAFNPQLSLHAYYNYATEDATTLRLKDLIANWHPVFGMSNDALAEKIRADGIDILIDLSGHTAHNKLLTFARKPAPLQASWMGYPGTTGLRAMDYYLADRFFLPVEQFAGQFTEKIVHLPVYAPFSPPADAPPVNELPALRNGYVTFGSFNRINKISKPVIALWAKVLRELPGSRIFLGGLSDYGVCNQLIGWFAEEGITQDRLSFHSRNNLDLTHHQVDICLDTFPYNGGTTTLHALWMGVPTLTLAGSTAPGRIGASALGNVGLPEFIAHDENDFVKKASFWAANLATLAEIRAGLRDRFNQSALGKPELIAKSLAHAFRIMWQRWCADLPPAAFFASETDIAADQTDPLRATEQLLSAILRNDPGHPEANHNMGLLSLQAKQTDAALSYFTRALDADPAQGQYWISYIDALIQSEQFDNARQILTLARQQGLQGEQVDALALRLNAQTQASLPPAESAQKLQQNDKPARQKLEKPAKPSRNARPGQQEMEKLVALFNQKKYTDAIILAKKMTERFPLHGFGWKSLGALYTLTGKTEDALLSMQKSAELLPGDAEAHNNLGFLLQQLGQTNDAEISYRRAIQIKPDCTDAYFNLGSIYQLTGRHEDAESAYRQTLKFQPGYAAALNNLGMELQHNGKPIEAEARYRQALQIKPDYEEAYNNLGTLFLALGKFNDAEASFQHAVQIRPNFIAAYNNMGMTLLNMGRPADAANRHRMAFQINPNYAEAYSNMFFSLLHDTAADPSDIFTEHLRFSEQFEAPLRGSWPHHTNDRDPQKRLQIGFVSGDLRSHAIARLIEPVLTHLAFNPQLSLHAYYNYATEDATTLRLKDLIANWHPVFGMSNDALAEKIRADGIDILIDLSGHTAHNKLLTFARKPAPLQASWMGYPGTTGWRAMDYYLADRFFLPVEQFAGQFTEKIVHLPVYAPFSPPADAPPVNELPALRNGYVTFGSFNRINKISKPVIALWAKVLRELPGSRMLLGGLPDAGQYETLVKWFSEEGVAQDRLSFHGRTSMDLLHHQVDICLDTFPYNGGTTTLHALWMGVPTLTLAGSTAPGRIGASALSNVGLPEFIAHDENDFVKKASFWAANLAALAEIRAGLRDRFNQSALGKPELIAKSLAHAFRIMWQRWCADLPPAPFEPT